MKLNAVIFTGAGVRRRGHSRHASRQVRTATPRSRRWKAASPRPFNAKDVDRDHEVLRAGSKPVRVRCRAARQYVGADAYRKDWKDFLATFKGPLKFEVSDLDVGVEGPIGYSHSIQHVTGTDTKDKPVDFTVRRHRRVSQDREQVASLCRSMFRCRWTSIGKADMNSTP